jgi:hypothetical protein
VDIVLMKLVRALVYLVQLEAVQALQSSVHFVLLDSTQTKPLQQYASHAQAVDGQEMLGHLILMIVQSVHLDGTRMYPLEFVSPVVKVHSQQEGIQPAPIAHLVRSPVPRRQAHVNSVASIHSPKIQEVQFVFRA